MTQLNYLYWSLLSIFYMQGIETRDQSYFITSKGSQQGSGILIRPNNTDCALY
jgi:hypothetical protein